MDAVITVLVFIIAAIRHGFWSKENDLLHVHTVKTSWVLITRRKI